MRDFFIAISIIGIVILAICCYKLKKAFDDLKKTVTNNRQSVGSEISTVDKKIRNCHSRLDEAAKVIKKQKIKISNNEKQLKDIMYRQEIDHIASELNSGDDIIEDSNEKTLDEEQLWAYNIMNTSDTNMFITGKAGTGKSYLLKYFVENTHKKTIVMAPTGVAALNINGVTIHSTFGYDNLEKKELNDSFEELTLNKDNRISLKVADTIIIDEISMVRVDVFEKIDLILRSLNKHDLPFGGKQLIIFGDLFQLSPFFSKFEKDKEKRVKKIFGSLYFFRSNAYKSGNFKFFELTINHRQQKDIRFFKILNNIREGVLSDEDLNLLNLRVSNANVIPKTAIKLYSNNDAVDKDNNSELKKIDRKEYLYNWIYKYYDSEDDASEDFKNYLGNIRAIEKLRLKQGAKIMMISNDVYHRWVNGTRAIVSYCDEEHIRIKTDRQHEYEVSRDVFSIDKPVYEDGRIVYKPIVEVAQYPIVLAYAITIHKSQGMTFNKVACDVGDCFGYGQAYVALSRCTNIDGLYLLNPITKAIRTVDPDVMKFYKSLQKQNR